MQRPRTQHFRPELLVQNGGADTSAEGRAQKPRRILNSRWRQQSMRRGAALGTLVWSPEQHSCACVCAPVCAPPPREVSPLPANKNPVKQPYRRPSGEQSVDRKSVV